MILHQMGCQGLLILMIWTGILQISGCRLILGRLLEVSQRDKILIRNTYKFSDIVMNEGVHNITRQGFIYNDIQQIPSLQLEINSSPVQKYYTLSNNLHAYVFRSIISISQLDEVGKNIKQQSKYEFILLDGRWRNQLGQNDAICYYGQEQDMEKEIGQAIRRCTQGNKEQIVIQKGQVDQLGILITSFLLFGGVSLIQILYFTRLCKQQSVV